MATIWMADIDGLGNSPIGHYDPGPSGWTWNTALNGYAWGATGLPAGYTNVVRGTGLSLSPPAGTVTSFHIYAPDGVTEVYSLTGVSVALTDMLNGITVSDPALGDIFVRGLPVLLQGDDTATGTSYADALMTGNASLSGGGHDLAYAGAGEDILGGGSGNDTLYGGAETDIISGGSGNDSLYGDGGNDLLIAEDSPTVAGFVYGPNALFGGDGDDTLWGQVNWGILDPIASKASTVVADGGSGFDILHANLAHLTQGVFLDLRDPYVVQDLYDGSRIVGIEKVELALGSGNDTVHTGVNGDVIHTGVGNDVVYWSGGSSTGVNLGDGDDVFYWGNVVGSFHSSNGGLEAGAGNDTLVADFSAYASAPITTSGFETIDYTGTAVRDVFYGGVGNDTFRAGAGHDEIWAGDGDDLLEGGLGSDLLMGDLGRDTLSYATSDAGVQIRLSDNTAAGGHATGDTIGGFEHVVGSAMADVVQGNGLANRIDAAAGHDRILGNSGADTLDGGQGSDTLSGGNDRDLLRGGNGADRLSGGKSADVMEGNAGNDTLTGGAGQDAFVFRPGDGTDRITDFANGDDVLDLRDFGFATRAHAISQATQLGADVVFSLSGGTVVVIENFQISLINGSDVLI